MVPSIPPTRRELESLATISEDSCLRLSVSGSANVNETVGNGSMEIRSVKVIKKMLAIEGANTVHLGSVTDEWKDMLKDESLLERRGGNLQ